MQKFGSLRSKIAASVTIGIVIIGGILIASSAISVHNSNTAHAEILVMESAEKYATELSASFERAFEGTHVTKSLKE